MNILSSREPLHGAPDAGLLVECQHHKALMYEVPPQEAESPQWKSQLCAQHQGENCCLPTAEGTSW